MLFFVHILPGNWQLAVCIIGLTGVSDTCHHPHRFNELATKSEKWNGKPRLECVSGRYLLSKTPVGALSWTCRSEGKWPSRQTGGKSNPHKWLASRKIWSGEELETLPAGTKPRTSHHRFPWRREAWKEEALDDLPRKDERGPSSIRRTLELFERRRWGNFWEMGWTACYRPFRTHRYHLELNWAQLNWTVRGQTPIKIAFSMF